MVLPGMFPNISPYLVCVGCHLIGQNRIAVLFSNAKIREGRCILSYRDCCFPCLPHGADGLLSDWYSILPHCCLPLFPVGYSTS